VMDFEAHHRIEKTQKAIDELIESFRFDAWSSAPAFPDPLGLEAAHLMIIGRSGCSSTPRARTVQRAPPGAATIAGSRSPIRALQPGGHSAKRYRQINPVAVPFACLPILPCVPTYAPPADVRNT